MPRMGGAAERDEVDETASIDHGRGVESLLAQHGADGTGFNRRSE